MSETREGWGVCDINSRLASDVYATQEIAEGVRQSWSVGHYYHVSRVRVTTEVLGAPPEPWCTVVNSTGAHHV